MKQLICSVLLAAAAVGCQKPAPSCELAPPRSLRPAPAPAGASSPRRRRQKRSRCRQCCRIRSPLSNGERISKADLEVAIRSLEQQNGGRSIPPERRDEIYRGVLDNLVSIRVLRQEVTARHMTASDADIAAHINELRKQFPTEAAFKQAMAAAAAVSRRSCGTTRAWTCSSTGCSKTKSTAKLSVKPGDVSAFYEKNPDKFKQSESVRASHILIIVPPGADAATKAAAKARAEEALKAARGGKDFAALARAVLTGRQRAARRRSGFRRARPDGAGLRERRLRAAGRSDQRCRGIAVRLPRHQGHRAPARHEPCRSQKRQRRFSSTSSSSSGSRSARPSSTA